MQHSLLLLNSLAICLQAHGGQTLTVSLGQVIAGTIESDFTVVETEQLEAYTEAPTVGVSYRLEVDHAGAVTIDLLSYDFDCYLVLRDGHGRVLAEDDDGLIGTHSRIVADSLQADSVYSLDVCALHGQRGHFELKVEAGSPAPMSAREREDLPLLDARHRVAAVEENHGAESEAMADALELLAREHYFRQQYTLAHEAWTQALEVRRQVHGPDHPNTAITLGQTASLPEKLGHLDEALEIRRQSVDILERTLGPDHLETAIQAYNLANLLEDLGDFESARSLFEQAHLVHQRELGPESPTVAKTGSSLADVLQDLGEFDAAESLYVEALRVRRKSLGDAHPKTIDSLSSLGLLKMERGEYDFAMELLEQAVKLSGSAVTLNNLALLHLVMGDYLAAKPLFEQSLAMSLESAGEVDPTTASILNNLGGVSNELGDRAESVQYYERALEVRNQLFGPEHPATATTMGNLATVLDDLGEVQRAEHLHQESLRVLSNTLGEDHPNSASAMNNLAGLYESSGDLASALPLYEKALAIRKRVLGPGHPNTAQSLNSLAMMKARLGLLDEALRLTEEAAQVQKGHIQRTLRVLGEGDRFVYLAYFYWQLELRISLARALDDPDAMRRAYDFVLWWKARIGPVLTSSRPESEEANGRPVDDLITQLRRCQDALSRLSLSEFELTPDQRQSRIEELGRERDRLERELHRIRPATDPGSVADFDSISAALRPDSALIDFLDHRSYVADEGWQDWGVTVWISRSGSEHPVVIDLGSAGRLEQAVGAFLQELVGAPRSRGVGIPAGRPMEEVAGAKLRQLLWDRIAPHLEGVQQVFITPDGVVGGLPFEALPMRDGSRAIERYSFVYLQDSRALLAAPTAPPAYDSLLMVGAVDFRISDDSQSAPEAGRPHGNENRISTWKPLPATGHEIQMISELHLEVFGDSGRRLMLQGAEPSEVRLKSELSRNSVLHLATHGFFRPEGLPSLWDSAMSSTESIRDSEAVRHLIGKHPGLLSGLVCAGASSSSASDLADGYLTAEELALCDLSRVELVVLSACETGLGRSLSGEGLIGLRHAFEVGGAKTVISSLWAVDDDSTAELMREFYENLWIHELPRGQALRRAQLELLSRSRKERGTDSVGSWGGFILSGEWR